MDGEFVRTEGSQVVLRRANGAEVKITQDQLIDADREYIRTQNSSPDRPASQAQAPAPKPTHKKGEELKEGDVIGLTFKPVNGAKVDLAAMGDKVVLLDFWATWCGPCIGELPNVKAAYSAYHAKGFEVIGISLDSDRGRLKDFIKENDMPWPQYFDGKGWENELAEEFNIRSIPAAFLIKNGTVIATDVRGHVLGEKLKELLP